ncbi:MAG: phosphoglucosamine mutase [Lachnospiraceae bacterium]|nr:phosphoglucosamine mutase [Lachnospiraceae bacterium]
MGKYFGTDGFRGEANVVLTVEHAFKIGRFIGSYYSGDNVCKVAIGKDTRRSSYMFEYALAAGLTASGADAYLLHVTTTPSVSYVVRTEDFSCGIMISASHNKFCDNGIKIVNEKGEKLNDDLLALIEAYLDGDESACPLATGAHIGRTVDYAMGRNRYVGHLIQLATRTFKGKRVGLDCANGSSWEIAKSIFDTLGAKTYVIHNEPNGININDQCGSTHIESLRALVKEEHLDVGFAFDGDCDRCFAVDEYGELINGDKILYICGKYMRDIGTLDTNTVVATMMSNLGLFKALEREGIQYEKTNVGDRFVYENMIQNGHSLGGEISGHIIFSKYAVTGDGLLTAIKLMEVMLECKKSLAQLAAGIKIYPQYQENVRVSSKPEARADIEVIAAMERITDILGDNGRIVVRESGTEPVIRVMVEAESDELCRKYVKEVVQILIKNGHAAGPDSVDSNMR